MSNVGDGGLTPGPGPGTVFLVGAGPGDPELLTVRAHRLLRSCDALVYDSLVPQELLDLVPEACERRFVGKRRGHHSVPQPAINTVLVDLAQRHRRVVRRLEQLNHNVLLQVQGKNTRFDIDGHDEIAAIARSFEYFASTVNKQQQELQQLSYTDSLTGLANRRAFELQFAQALVQAQRQHWPLTLMMIDVDCFKAYNDQYGHQAGDDTLQQIAQLLQQGINRGSDLVARYGGEEFIALLPETDAKGAVAIADQLLHLFRQAALPHQFNLAGDYVSISLGICSVNSASSEDYNRLLRLADNALYQAKANGRNCYYVSQ